MATYTEKLWGSSSGTYPTSVLTKRWTTTNETAVQCIADSGGEGGYVFEQEWSAAARRLNSLDAAEDGNHANIELLCRFRLEGTTRADYEFGLAVRGSGSGGSETAYECYLLEGGTNDIGLRLTEQSAGSPTLIADTGDLLFDVGTEWLWLRFRANGTSLKAKLWRDRDVEPTAWQADETDSVITAAGWNGLWGYTANYRTDVDYLSAGTNGDTAPKSASTTTKTRVTAAYASALKTTPTTPVRVSAAYASVLKTNPTTPVRVSGAYASVLYKIAYPSGIVSQQVAEVAVQQDLANVETRSTQQIVEVLVDEPIKKIITQQVAEIAVQQDLASVEVRSTQQILETLYKVQALYVYTTSQVAEVAVQNSANVYVRNTQQVVEVLMLPPINDPAYDNYDAQPISVMF